MSSYMSRYIGKKILGENLQNRFGKEDPYFDKVPATRLNGKLGKKLMKKRKKALPPGISEHDGHVLTKVKRRAYRLDLGLFNFCGVRFGWGSAIGLMPFAGDAMDAVLALMVLRTCEEIEGGLPSNIRIRMLFNIAFDFFIGLVPFIGDLADALFRANTRNAVILEEFLRKRGQKALRQSGQSTSIDPSSHVEFDRDDDEDAQQPENPPSHSQHENGVEQVRPVPPNPARAKENRGWFSRGKARPRDVEMG